MSVNRMWMLNVLGLLLIGLSTAEGQVCGVSGNSQIYVKDMPSVAYNGAAIREMPLLEYFETAQNHIVRIKKMGGGGDCQAKDVFDRCSILAITDPAGTGGDLAMNLGAQVYQLPLHAKKQGNYFHHLESDPWDTGTAIGKVTFYISLLDEPPKKDIINKYYHVEAFANDCPPPTMDDESKKSISETSKEASSKPRGESKKSATSRQSDVGQGHEGKP